MGEATKKDYNKLVQLSRESHLLHGAQSILEWDHETYMPSGAADIRSEQLKVLAGLIHRSRTSLKYRRALQKLIDIPSGHITAQGLSEAEQAALLEWRRNFLQDTLLPAKFVENSAQLSSRAMLVWRAAKKNNAFSQFAPYLDQIITMNRKKADYLGYKDHPYDALLDHYEPNLTTKEVEVLFGKLRLGISSLLKKIENSPQVKDEFLHGDWNIDKQLSFSHLILDAMGYDKSKGRLDLSAHPCSMAAHPTDSRITTRIHPTSLISNISAVLHEGGHALYEMGLPQNEYGTPLGEARSLGIHESQSRWWETRIGLTQAFWKHFLPLLKETFKGQLDSISLEQFWKAINKVKASFIRVEADEVTYPLHVILRFELEKGLIEGSLKVRDLPEAWNEKMQAYLGITPSTVAEGVLQDIHWSMGAFGYFPTYTLGNIYTSHLFDSFAKQHPNWEERVSKGELEFIREWLQNHIYQHGKRYSSQELLKRATGSDVSSEAYMKYLNSKYQSIYGF